MSRAPRASQLRGCFQPMLRTAGRTGGWRKAVLWLMGMAWRGFAGRQGQLSASPWHNCARLATVTWGVDPS